MEQEAHRGAGQGWLGGLELGMGMGVGREGMDKGTSNVTLQFWCRRVALGPLAASTLHLPPQRPARRKVLPRPTVWIQGLRGAVRG